jgi:hypothetical protein
MAVPNKKMYDRSGKVIFDPSNPEDVRRQEELNKQIEMAKQLFSIVDPRGGGGIGAMARGISKAALAKMSKSKFTQNKAKQILELVTKPMTRGKKAASNTRKQAAPTVKEVVETKPTVPTTIPTSGSTVSDKIKSLSNAEIKAFENVKKARELAEKQVKNTPTTTTPKKRVSDIVREAMDARKLGTKGPTREEMKLYYQKTAIAKKTAKDIVTNKKLKTELEKIRETNKPFYEKSIKEAIDASNKKIAIGTGIIGGLAAAGYTYYGMQSLLNKDNKQTTGPVDLKRINPDKIRPSKIEGVSIVKGSDGKDYGIKWNNTTGKWEYYKGDGKPVVKTTPKQETVTDNTGGGGVTPIKDNKKTTGTGGGNQTTTTGSGNTTPRSATGQSFDKAFAEARKQAGGAGGIFEWNGKKYGTALKGETVPKNRVEVGKKEEYPTFESDPSLATLRQQDDDKQLLARAEAQKKEMESKIIQPLPTKPLSELVFKTTAKAAESQKIRNSMDEQNALRSIIADNRMPLKKKRYGGNLAMLKYMKQ